MTQRVPVYDYHLKFCPSCGADHLVWHYSAQEDAVQAMYDCDCSDANPYFAALYDRANRVRRQYLAFEESLLPQYRQYLTKPLDITDGNLDAEEAASAFEPGQLLFLHGPTGIGKTHIAVRAALRSVELGVAVRFISEIDLIDEYRSRSFTTEGAALPHTLLLDDVGKEGKPGDFYAKTFFRVLEACRTLIMTSQDSPAGVARATSLTPSRFSAIEGRINDGKVIPVSGVDRRVGTR